MTVKNLLRSFQSPYLIVFLLVYTGSVLLLVTVFHQSLPALLTPFLFFGILFSLFAWLLLRNSPFPRAGKQPFKAEFLLLIAFILFFGWYVTFGSAWINGFFPPSITAVAWKNSIAILVKKLLLFVAIPFLIYRVLGFSVNDFGLSLQKIDKDTGKTWWVVVILSILIILYQFMFGGGSQPIREGRFGLQQLLLGLPVLFLWLFIEVGLVEEFFFRALLQSRITAIMRSPAAGILLSGLVFGLAHAPGLYLRGAESEGVTEQMPFVFWAAYTITAMSVAGIFLGVIWHRTKNLWLLMALHAMVDLLPNFPEFVETWRL